MSAHPPPTPPANRSDKGPGEASSSPNSPSHGDPSHGVQKAKAPGNLGEQGETGNMKQNVEKGGTRREG